MSDAIQDEEKLMDELGRLLQEYSASSNDTSFDQTEDSYRSYYYIYYDRYLKAIRIKSISSPLWKSFGEQLGVVYFPTRQMAQEALDKIVLPFVAQHQELLHEV